MTITSNMISDNSDIIININNEFKLLNNLFKSNGWEQIENSDKLSENITYSKKGNETEFFEITLHNNNIYVSIPLKNSDFQYKTKFADYYSAIKYTGDKFIYFIEN